MSHHLSRRDVDRILDAPGESDHPVGQAMQALRAPASTSELQGEDATVSAFHAARLSPTSRPMSGFAPSARSAAVRAVAGTGLVVALSTGGFALAASGHLPTLPVQAADTATEAVARTAHQTNSPGETTTEAPTEAPTEVGTTTVAPETTAGTATSGTNAAEAATTAPVPSFTGLCTAYRASDKSAHGKALDSAAFTALATAAGSKDAIATYCVGLIGEPKVTGKPTGKPTQAATGKPTQAATGKPTQAATGKPTQAATGKPTTQPTTQTPTGQPTAGPSPTDRGKPSEAGKPAGTGKPEKTGKP